MTTHDLQRDQQPARWSDHVCLYETVFEPLTNRFAKAAIVALKLKPGDACLDVAAGSGGAALMAARQGATVTAIDASPNMVARIASRAAEEDLSLHARVMDAAGLDLRARSFEAALSVFGIILCPDPVGALREIRRVLVPGGRVALVTWTEPEHYELVARLMAAIRAVGCAHLPSTQPPAQLRFTEESRFCALFEAADFEVERVERLEANLEARSALWLAERLDFAPGLAAMLAGLANDRIAVIDRFVADLVRDQGQGAISLRAVAFLGVGRSSAAPVPGSSRRSTNYSR